MKKTKLKTIILILTILQIALLTNTGIAQSYTIHESDVIAEKVKIDSQKNPLENVLNKGLRFLISFLSIKQIGTVSAAEVCCEKVQGEGWCEEADENVCDRIYNVSGTECSLTTFCKPGYCFDPEYGICSAGSPREKCIREGGEWTLNFNAEKCLKGCCYLGPNTRFVESGRCELLSAYQGIDMSFDNSVSERECRFLSEDMGACIKQGGSCEYVSEIACEENYHGDFNNGIYCSDPSLDTNCVYHGGGRECVDGSKDIYWFDSCGNREDIAQTCVSGETYCGYSSERNRNECMPVNCGDRKDGESWCDYDVYVGEKSVQNSIYGFGENSLGSGINNQGTHTTLVSSTVPGSSHWIKYCNKGEIITKLCGDGYREQVCAEKIVDETSRAQCRTNFATLCLALDYEDCVAFPDCHWQTVDVTGGSDEDNFKFGACVATYPKGFDNDALSGYQNGKDVCGLIGEDGKVTCTYVEQKGWDFGWTCKVNCGCWEQTFVEQVNDFCQSLGDCGVNINLEGEISGRLPLTNKYDRPTTNEWYDRYKYLLTKENVVGANTPKFLLFEGDVEQNEEDTIGTSFEIPNLVNWGTWDYALIIIMPLRALTKWIFGIGSTRERETTFTCLPWKPVTGGDDCEKCNEDPDKACNDYRCESLGTACQLETNVYDSERPFCYDMFSDDEEAPTVTFERVTPGTFTTSKNTITIKPTGDNCYVEYTKVNLTMETNEYSECRWDYENKPIFEDMENFILEENLWSTTHTIENFKIIKRESGEDIYIRCADRKGNFKSSSTKISFCVRPIPDTFEPVLERFIPADGSYLPVGARNSTIKLYLNEPAQCKFDLEPNTKYENMSYYMLCNVESLDSQDYHCISQLNITSNTTKTYFRCNDSVGNINLVDKEYALYITRNPLEIISVSPTNGTLIDRPVSSGYPFYLEATTLGGVDRGVSICNFKFVEQGWLDFFLETNSTKHKYTFTSLPEGNHTIEIFCRDRVGNTAKQVVEFSSDLDEEPPIIVRAYRDGGYLKIITDEEAICYHSPVGCGFNLEDGTEMSSSYTTGHIVDWNPRTTYYIKCKDEGGWPSSCRTFQPSDTY
ncbi:MAG: hypothetical protein ABIH59_01200 [archaeon]